MVDRHQQPRAVDCPEPCFVRLRTERKGRWYGARIFLRLGVLIGEINGLPASPDQVWHGGDVITEAEYHALLRAANELPPF